MKQQMQPGETFGFRIPTHANREVLDYFNAYLRQSPRGLGKRLLEVLKKGLELEGALPPGLPEVGRPRPRRRGTWHAARKVRTVPQWNPKYPHVQSRQFSSTAGATTAPGVNVDDVGTQTYFDLGNFE